jgi:hypothetical protein
MVLASSFSTVLVEVLTGVLAVILVIILIALAVTRRHQKFAMRLTFEVERSDEDELPPERQEPPEGGL